MATLFETNSSLSADMKNPEMSIRAIESCNGSMQQVFAWNETQPTLVNQCAHELIKQQVDVQPNAVAVHANDAILTYERLDDLSTRLAHLLVKLGVQVEDIVPLCFEKSAWAIVSILGVIKAGAAFVFVDPSHPESRREIMMSQVEAKLVITSPQQAALWENSAQRIIVADQASIEKLPIHDQTPETGVRPSNLLYVIFTSGSTGTPKGCQIEHSAFCSGSVQHAEKACILPSSRVLQLASFVFDVSILEILTSLISGACICLPSTAAMQLGPAHLINDLAITWTFLTPSLAKMVQPSDIPKLKTLALGGEPLSKLDVETWAGCLQLVNGYGPSECSIAATGNTHMTPETDPFNIGWAVGGLCWIVDAEDHDRLVPAGDVGELLIEGPILARGYLKNQTKTDEVFIKSPLWGPETNSGDVRRVYKTGDLAKFNPNGSVHFIGRKDTQVKLRGLRIELGEIEHHIANHDHTEHKMVILPKSGLLKERLIAVVTLSKYTSSVAEHSPLEIHMLQGQRRAEVDSQISSIRAHLASLVPEYMVPETWVVLEQFPLLLSGKLNRSLVQKWITEVDEATFSEIADLKNDDEELEDAITTLEVKLREIYAAVLNLPTSHISLSRSFLSLGGDSITAMQVMSRCRALGLAITVKDLLRSKSITEVCLCAGLAEESLYSKDEAFDTAFDLSPVQKMYFDLLPKDESHNTDMHFNQSFFLRLTRRTSEDDLKAALEAVVGQHSMLRARFEQNANGKWVQRVLKEVVGSYGFSSHGIESKQDADPIMATSQLSLNILNGPVFAVNLFQTTAGEQLLFLVAHHVMIDLVSWRTILQDLENFLTVGAPATQQPMPFQKWLQLQTEYEAQRSDLSTALPFKIPAPDFDYWEMAGKSNTIGETLEQRFQLDRATTTRLLGDACHTPLHTEPLHILLSALVHSFRLSFPDRQVPAMFREGHGREPWDNNIDISQTVGWFTTMYPLHVELGMEDDVVEIIKRVKDASHSVPDNGRPYFASRYLNERGIEAFGHHDQVEISFDYLGLYQQLERSDALLQQVPGYEAATRDVGPDVPRFSLIEVTAEVILGQMQLSFVFNSRMKNQEGLQAWVNNCKQSLVNGTELLVGSQRQYTLADLPQLSLNYDSLDELIHRTLPRIDVFDVEKVENIYPCSPMQHGLLIAQNRSANGYYEYFHTMKVETRKEGQWVDVDRLQTAWKQVVQRHSSLRTVFIESVGEDGLYDQVVFRTVSPRMQLIECEDIEIGPLLEIQDPITFQGNEPPHRLTIYKTASKAVFCRLDINHAIIDGASISNIVNDLISAYDHRISPKPGFLYETYISHVLKHPATSTLGFWTEYLSDVKPCLFPALAPFENPARLERQLENVDVQVKMLPATLNGFCRENNVTLVNLFHLAWGLVLRAYTNSEEVCFGYLSTGRDVDLDKIEEGVGAFITMLICRPNFQTVSPLTAILDKVAEDYSRSLPNQYCDLATIQHSLGLAGEPLFNTIMSFHRDSNQEVHENSSITIEGLHGHDPTEYALAVDVGVSDACIDMTLGYWTSDFTEQQVKNIGSTFVTALKCVMQRTSNTINEIDLVGEDHILQMQSFSNNRAAKVDKCIHDVIQAQIDASPDEEAICSWEGSWTYRELDKAATKLAHHLVSLGAGPETIIPYCFPKSAWAIVSILAILKSGAAAVALDPAHPVKRLKGLVEEVDASIVLTTPQTSYLFDGFRSVQKVVGVQASLIDELPSFSQPPCVIVNPSNAAFVVFTSGTTGKPKGIVLEHSALCTCAATMGSVLGIGPGTRMTQFASYTFDVSLQDIITTLQRGGTICVISDYQKMDDLADGINSTRANWADITSTVASLLRPTDVPSLKRLNTGGEPLTREVVDVWADHVALHNLYGPAETTINNTCSKRLSKDSSAANIGKCYGSSGWIVDADNTDRLVPMGCVGELIVEGPLLARHYLNEPEKTKAAFLEDPAWTRDGSSSSTSRRFYKTGDLCSFNTDGTLNIFGRRDGQVKINGQRVELDEIMYQVQSRLPSNQQTVVDAMDIEELARGKTIITYIYAQSHAQYANSQTDIQIPISSALDFDLKSLQASLAESLPRYMIPSMYIPVTRIPITPSGKMDRAILRQMVSNLSKEQLLHYMLADATTLPVTTEMEFTVQALWSQVLGVEKQYIGVNDNFFGLGGDSVGAMKLAAAARGKKIAMSVSDIFASPTLSAMARAAKYSDIEQQATLSVVPFGLIKDPIQLESILDEASGQCGVDKHAIQNCYPTSALQEGLMALSIRQPGVYLAQKVFRVPSEGFDLLLFQEAWAAVIKSADIMRTRIVHTQSSGSLQLVLDHGVSWIVATDLETYLAEDLKTPIEYGGPLLRLAIVEQNHMNTYFVWTAHHAVYDGWTVNLLFEAVAKVYANGTMTQSTPYERFVDYLAKTEPTACNNFWQAQLVSEATHATGYPSVPLGYQALAKQSMMHSVEIATIADSSITISSMIRAAWALVISTYSDSKDVIFAATLSGRSVPIPGIDTIMGPTITTVPVRISLMQNDATAGQYLQNVQDQATSMMPYEQIGLQNIRYLSSGAQSAIDQIQNLLVVQPYEASEDVPSFLEMEALSRPSASFDTYALVLECCVGRERSFDITASYDSSIITEEQMKRMLQQLEHVVGQLITSPEVPLSKMGLLSPQEFHNIKDWNHDLPQAINEVVRDQIAEEALHRPDAPAICAWDGDLTYRGLDSLSTRLAQHLLTLGVGPEVRVGLCFDKSKWNVVSMLAILKAGGVCVQLLPTYPGPRIQSILEDIEATVVLAAPQHHALFGGLVDSVIAVWEETFASLPEIVDEIVLPNVQPDNAAFIVFTSGSTGRPKGVVIENGGFCTMTHYQSSRIHLGPQARVLQFASHAFDICLFESFATLLCGGCVCIPSEAQRLDDLAGAINKLDANWLIMVSTVADTFSPDEVPGVNHVILGGEPLRADIHARWANSVDLINDYGPAECSILAVMTESHTGTPPSMIGKGLGCRTWVTHKDDHDILMPIGCVGELLVEGPIVARGYLKDVVKTEAAYISAPAWSMDITPRPSRLYKTGDLVRYDGSGNLHCLGRKDTQIKIRGLRVELGEIEHHIKTSGFQTDHFAAERVLQQGDVEKAALVAFIALKDGNDASSDYDSENLLLPVSQTLNTSLLALRDHIGQSLQSYMVPTIYVLLRKMPETQTGKIDRKTLRQIGASLSNVQLRQYSLLDGDLALPRLAPDSIREKTMQAVWSEVLTVPLISIGADDNFFKMGGDSVRAMRLAATARKSGLKLTVAEIFNNPVLSSMALVATAVVDVAATVVEPKPFSLLPEKDCGGSVVSVEDAAYACNVEGDNVEDIYPCTPLQEGMMSLSIQNGNGYMATRVFQLHKNMDVERFKDCWQRLVDLHPILRTRIIPAKSSGALQVIVKEAIVWKTPMSLDEYLMDDKATPVGYGSALTRFAIDVEQHHFIWTAHHALYDGFSANLLFNQLEQIYYGSAIPRVIGYTRFIKKIMDVDASASASFWRSQLGGGAPTSFPQLPTTAYQPNPDMELKKSVEFRATTGSGIMVSTMLRAAWAIITARRMDSDDVVFGTTLSGRNAAVEGIEEIVAPTITTVPIRIQLEGTCDVSDFLEQVQNTSTKMIPFQHTGLQYIHRLGPEVQAALALKNLFVVQQPDGKTEESGFLPEIHDPSLLQGFHTYAVVMECLIEDDENICLHAQFDQAVVSKPQMTNMLCQFEHVLSQLNSTVSGKTLSDIEIFGPLDLQQTLEWNNAVELEIVDDCVHNSFRDRVLLQPEAEAICAWDGSLTYLQLDKLSDKLASYLVGKGVQPEVLVPLCFAKSVLTVVTMLSVLKAGGACVHLGVTQPLARSAQIIADTEANFLLADSEHSDMFQGIVEVVTIDLAFLQSLDSAGPLPIVLHTNPAFVLFTSGSTGKPKGIVVEHGSLCTSSKAHGTNRNIGPHTRLLQFAAYTFDVSVADIFTTLQRGGCVCVPSEEERTNDLAGAINRMDVNYGFLTPTVAGLLTPGEVPALRTLILGGEMLTQDNIQTWAPALDLIISYGMAECSIHCVDAVPLTLTSNPANLGRSSGCLMWIVEKENHNKLAPIGCVGELIIEGRMVSRGYLNDDLKTRAAFIEDPTWALSSANPCRMYKTGDLAKYSDDGEIVYVGRKDFQVKHHGQRIELTEIEHHLLVDSQVKHAVAILPKSGYSQGRLVGVLSLHAFVAPAAGAIKNIRLVDGPQKGIAELQLSSIRSSLAASVPDYMVPAIWMVVQAIPLTANGKMDRVKTRQWLEEMDETTYEVMMNGDQQCANEVAVTNEEEKLQRILMEILSLPTINVRRSFLDLGGDSIGAMQLKAKCHTEGIELTVRDILTCKSISELAMKARFDTDSEGDLDEALDTPFGLSVSQKMYLDEVPSFSPVDIHDRSHDNSCLLQLTSETTVYRLARAIEAMVQRHSMLRVRLGIDDTGEWTQILTREVSRSYHFEAHAVPDRDHMNDQLSANDITLNIGTGPVFSAHLFNIGDETEIKQQFLFMSVHSLAADMDSLHILVRDIEKILSSKTLSMQKPLSYQRWIRYHEERIHELHQDKGNSSGVRPSNSDYWGMDGLVNVSADVIEKSIIIDPQTTLALLDASNVALRTRPVDLLLSAIALSFRLSFQDRSTPTILSRTQDRGAFDAQIDASGTVGRFTKMYPLVLTGDEDLLSIIGKAKDCRVQRSKYEELDQAIHPDVHAAIPIHGKFPAGRSHHELLFVYDEDSSLPLESNSLLRLESLPVGLLSRKTTKREALLEVSIDFVGNAMRLNFCYNRHMHHQDKIGDWITKSQYQIYEAIHQLQGMEAKHTLSDFPLLRMDYSDLAKLDASLTEMGLKPADVSNVVPCSPIQHRMLCSQKETPGTYQSDTWHAIKASPGSEPVDEQRLRTAWQKVVNRHEALRTIFIPSQTRMGQFDQVILQNRHAEVQLVRFGVRCEQSEILEIVENHHAVNYGANRPHSVFTIFRDSCNNVYCKLEISHALQDGMSTRIIYQDLVSAYEDSLPSTPTAGFQDYVSWLHRQDLAPSVNYWKDHLADVKPCCLPHQANNSIVGRKNLFIPVELPESCIIQLPEFCKKNGITMATVFQTAWALVLCTYTSSNDIIFGYMTANRDVPIAGITEMVGPLINMLLCRLHTTDDTVITHLLEEVAAEFIVGVEHQYGLVEAVQQVLDDSPEPIWNTVMSLEYGSEEGAENSPLVFETIGGTRSPEYDVVIGVRITEKKIETQLGYWDNVMTSEHMERMGQAYVKIVDMILSGEERTLSELDS